MSWSITAFTFHWWSAAGLENYVGAFTIGCDSCLWLHSALRCEMTIFGSKTPPRVPITRSQEGVSMDSVMTPVNCQGSFSSRSYLPCVILLDLFMTIVLRILLKLTHYSFYTDRVLSSTFPAIVALWLQDITPCQDSFVVGTTLNLPNQVPKPNSPLPVKKTTLRTWVFIS